MRDALHYLPIVSTVVAIVFARELWIHWRRSPQVRHIMWWTIGVVLFGVGTLTEALTTMIGWHEPIFRAWYIAGALLGGAPLAQGSVYLLLKRRTADRLTMVLVAYITVAAVLVLTSPITPEGAAAARLDGDALGWQWVRLLSPPVNTYALIYLVGGAIWSARHYRSQPGSPSSRVLGNWLIAIGALLPGIGGAFTRAGYVEVLYVGELVGLLLIYRGYRLIAGDRGRSIHPAQQSIPTTKGTDT